MEEHNCIDEARSIGKISHRETNQEIFYMSNFTDSNANFLPEIAWIMFEKRFNQGFNEPSRCKNYYGKINFFLYIILFIYNSFYKN